MKYFNYFPNVEYLYGDEKTLTIGNNLSVYAEVVDTIADNAAFYLDYTIQEFERPDQVSFKLYKTPNYHWTFFLLNPKLRGSGWPLSNRDLLSKAQADYSKKVITTRTVLTDKFKVGQTIQGNTSAAEATIDHRHLDFGQLVLTSVSGAFEAGEVATSTNSNGDIESINIASYVDEYEAAHHYENASGEYVDIDPTVGAGSLLTPITYLDRLISENDQLKNIRAIKPNAIDDIVSAFREAVRSG